MAATLHSICGKIGAGKSTLADELAAPPGVIAMSEDTWLAGLYPGEIADLPAYADRSRRLRRVLGPHLQALLAAGITVGLDFPANRLQTRDWARDIARAAGAAHVVHWLDVPDAECLARLRRRNALGQHPFQTNDAEFAQITALFEPPRAGEGSPVVHHSWPF